MTERIFLGEDQLWYFHVRGNQAVGPFPSSQEAAEALARHVTACKRRTESALPWPTEWSPARLLKRSTGSPRHG